MSLKFTKMHGLGNDFIVIDATKEPIKLSPELITKLADRRTGIGFDQLLVIEPASNAHEDFFYRIFNADGGQVEQCGNGARCIAHYIFTQGLSSKNIITLGTIVGKIILQREENNSITANMGIPQFCPAKIPFITQEESLTYTLTIEGQTLQFGVVALGNPHAVCVVDDVSLAPVSIIGKALQHHAAFPKQVNVGFMQIISPTCILLRVFERGVGETQACGSGACAAMVIGRLWQYLDNEVTVKLLGGNLRIHWDSKQDAVHMTGPAELVYQGHVLYP